MKTIYGIAAWAILVSGTGARAEESQNDNAARQEKRICKSEKMTGSLTRVRRTCLTQREWDRLAEGTRKGIDNLERDSNRALAIPSPLQNGR